MPSVIQNFLSLFKNDAVDYSGKCRSPLSKEDFREFLNRERAKADRAGTIFSIVSFPVLPEFEHAGQYVFDFCSHVLRITDEIGWVEEKLHFFLFENTKAGAMQFIERLRLNPNLPLNLDLCTIYTYPEEAEQIFREREAQRKHRRINVDLEAILVSGKRDTIGDTSNVSIQNISTSGAFLRVDQSFKVGEKVTMQITLPLAILKGLGHDTIQIIAHGAIARTASNGLAVAFDDSYVMNPLFVSQADLFENLPMNSLAEFGLKCPIKS